MKIGNIRPQDEFLADTWQRVYSTTLIDAISNADLDNEDMADITDWTDNDSSSGVSTQETFDGKSCMKLTGGATIGGAASRLQDLGAFGTRTVFSLSVYCDTLGTQASDNIMQNYAYDGSTVFIYKLCTDGLFIYNGSAFVEVGTDLVVADTWQEWTFDVDWTARTVDVYLNKELKASDVDISADSTTANGTVVFFQFNYTTAFNSTSYIDWFKAGSDFTIATLATNQIRGSLTSLTISGLDGNEVYNSDFETWAGGVSSAPNWWTLVSTGTVERESTIVKTGTYSMKTTCGAAGAEMIQDIAGTDKNHSISYWRGKTITFGCWVWCAAAGRANLLIWDGVGGTSSVNHSGSSTWEWITVTRTIDASATSIQITCSNSAAVGNVAYYDGVIVVVGASTPQTTSTNQFCLNGNTAEEYILRARIVNGYNGAAAITVKPNNDVTTNIYGYQYLLGNSSDAPSAARSTASSGFFLTYMAALSNIGFGDLNIFAKSGYVRTAINNSARTITGTTVTQIFMSGLSWNNTADNITSLVILASEANAIGVGSVIELFAKKSKV